jgi:putative oxidoreductase
MLSDYYKLFNAERHRTLADELKALGVPAVGFNIILVTMATSGRQRIKLYMPIDRGDRIDDWLYLPETLYAVMLIMVVSAGAGPYSLDAVILPLIDKHIG